jgi:hypothetical protein
MSIIKNGFFVEDSTLTYGITKNGFNQTGITINGVDRSPCIFEFQVVATQTISGVFQTSTAANEILVDWGDGSSDSYAGTSDQAYSKNYGSVGDRVVKIYAANESYLTKFTMTQSGANISFDLADAPEGLTYLFITGSNTISGSIAGAPSGLNVLYVLGSNTISGSIAGAPSGLTYLVITGFNTISGPIDSAPSGLTTLRIEGSNTISGSIAGAPSGLTTISIYGSNTISGSIAGAPSGLTSLIIIGSNQISGPIDSAPSGLITLIIIGSNTISGSIAGAPSGLTYIRIEGSNTISDYTTPWPLKTINFNSIIITPTSGGLSTAEVDQLIIDADTSVVSWTGSKIITLTGTNAVRTSASDAAVASLTTKNVTVTTN